MPTVDETILSWSQIVSNASTYISGTTFTIPARIRLNTSTDKTNLLSDKLGDAVTTIEWNGPINKASDESLISLDGMFYNCKNVSKITFGDAFITSLANVDRMLGMFYGCSALTEIKGITKWDLSTVDTIARMFFGCSNLMSIDIHGWKLNPDGVNTSFVFANCFTEATTTSGKKGYIYATKTVMDALCGENQAYSMNGSVVNSNITSIYRDDDNIEDNITGAAYNKYTVSYTPLDHAISLDWVGYNSDL